MGNVVGSATIVAVIFRAATDAATTPRARRVALAGSWQTVVPIGAAVAVFWLAYDGGAYSLQSWTKAAIVTWWAVLIGVVAGLLPRARIGRSALACLGLILAFSVWSGLSAIWADSAEAAVTALARGLLYCGVLTLVLFLCTRSVAVRSSDLIALGLVSVGVLALLSRCFPTIFPTDRVLVLLPDAHTRLNYPVAYWNGLAILVGLATPLLLRTAVWGRSPIARAAALAPFPAIAAVMYLSSSRSGSVTAAVGAIAFVALCGRRWQAAGAVALAAVGSIVAVAVLDRLHTLVDGPLDGSAAHSEGRTAALALIVLALATAACWRIVLPRLDRLEVSRTTGRIVVGLLVLALVAGVAASGPVGRWHTFTQPPDSIPAANDQNEIQSHLFSVSGNWRWQYWESAFDEWQTRPLVGRGAGSFTPWWSEHGDEIGFIGNAHSLYAQTLAELGLIGFGLIAGGFVLGLAVAIRRALGMRGSLGDTAAAVTAGFAAYAVAAGIDWMWELPAVSVVGFVLLGLAVGPATGAEEPAVSSRPRMKWGARAAVAAAAAVVLLLELNVLAGDIKIGDSQAAAAAGNLAAARSDARAAHRLQPWAATPWLQQALVDEQGGRLASARAAVRKAIEHDRASWQLWLIASRIQDAQGDHGAAQASYEHARSLTPHASFFTAGPNSVAPPSSPPPTALVTAIHDPMAFPGSEAPLAFAHARAAGTTAVRILIQWRQLAPKALPSSSDPASPANPGYDWSSADRQVTLAVKAGLEPIVGIYDPPGWATKPTPEGRYTPELRNPGEDFGNIMLAAARRYSGSFQGLPRVRYWEAWNEPNLGVYLTPQWIDQKPASPAIYREMVNAAADAVHSVHADNKLVAGEQAPFAHGGRNDKPFSPNTAIAPMTFMRELLCMSEDTPPKPTCSAKTRFDIWSHHPYTQGGPGTKSQVDGNVSLGDLPQMKSLLDAAVSAGHVVSDGPVPFWVDEFSWDSKPPDPQGVPVALEAQWISGALYEMWTSGVSLVAWYLIHDVGPSVQAGQSGLYTGDTIATDKPKPLLAAYRFPFVGYVRKGKIGVWGRTPWGRPGRVLVEESTTKGWRRLGVVATNRNGIFTHTFGAPRGALVRARVLGTGGLSALPYPLAGPRNLKVDPFGAPNA